MEEYDIVVIGSGAGMIIVEESVNSGKKVALIDKGPRLGGTCLNYGCVPSKMLIHTADRVMEIRKARELGIDVNIEAIDFNAIISRMRKSRDSAEKEVRKGIRSIEGLDFYEGEAYFTDDYTLNVNGEIIKGNRIFLASGSRPVVPPIKGLDTVDCLTNETVLELKDRPESLIIIGGGYIGVEYAHFFEAMGTKVTIIEMSDRLVMSEEPEMADMLLKELRKRLDIMLNAKVVEIKKEAGLISVITEDAANAKTSATSAKAVMIAIGRRSNADLLKVENSGIDVDNRRFIKVDDFFETNKKNIYAVGDANGQQMFTHVANREAALAIHNVLETDRAVINRDAVPHAVYSYPQIASVGLRESEAREKYSIVTSTTRYFDTAKGEAMMERDGFTKVILDKESGNILGFHVIGPYAPILVQEVVNAMSSGGNVGEINDSIHIHPALSELIPMSLY